VTEGGVRVRWSEGCGAHSPQVAGGSSGYSYLWDRGKDDHRCHLAAWGPHMALKARVRVYRAPRSPGWSFHMAELKFKCIHLKWFSCHWTIKGCPQTFQAPGRWLINMRNPFPFFTFCSLDSSRWLQRWRVLGSVSLDALVDLPFTTRFSSSLPPVDFANNNDDYQ
jgi:hypothetical protein